MRGHRAIWSPMELSRFGRGNPGVYSGWRTQQWPQRAQSTAQLMHGSGVGSVHCSAGEKSGAHIAVRKPRAALARGGEDGAGSARAQTCG